MASPELDILHSIMNRIDHPEVVDVADYSGYWVVTLRSGSKIEIHYKIQDPEMKGESP
jgi:hypothetical protein